jgi:outer membrane protein, heavy metal efflux system
MQVINMIKHIKYILLSLLILLTAGTLQAQSLEEYMAMAARENPELKARFNDYHASLERLPQVSSLPDPKVMIGYFIEPVRSRAGDFNFNASLSQQFPWFGLLKARRDVAARQAEAKLKAFEALRNQVFFQVKKNWYALYELEQQIRITRENMELLQYMESQALKKYETGQAQMVDVIRVQMQIKDYANELQKLSRDRNPLQARFNALLNREATDSVHVSDEMVWVEGTGTITMDSVLAQNPQLQQLQARQMAAQHQIKEARLSGYPTINLGINYTSVSAYEAGDMTAAAYNGNDVVQPFVSISIPLYRKKYDAMEQEADFKLKKVQHDQQALKNNLRTAFEESRNELEDARDNAALFSEQVKQSKQALNLLTRSFSTAGKDFEEVLRMQQQLLKYEMALIRARIDQNIALARLQMLASSIG